MLFSFLSQLLLRIWAGLLLLMVAMLMGGIMAGADGPVGHLLFAGILMGLISIAGVLVLIGACRLLIATARAVLWR